MNVKEKYPQPELIHVRQFCDDRGKFMARPMTSNWIQQNISVSKKGVFRGMHSQIGNYSQTKLVRVLAGKVIDVVVDIRNYPDNPNYLKFYQFQLSDGGKDPEHSSLLVPKGFAHGFLALEDNTIFEYLVDAPYHPESDRSLHYSSFPLITEIATKHNLQLGSPLISEKDDAAPTLQDWLLKDEPTLPLL